MASDPEARKLKKHLTELTTAVLVAVDLLDGYGNSEQDKGRGAHLAKITNALEMANDQARYFGLGVDYRTDRKRAAPLQPSS